ncbi:MAG: efflux RND transporter periplasmic adaptor subunit [Candidatus Aminicenantes bacterium]|nr:efflux RND transporter periplasmic adaptor subunit [Candidatus Aminicenantes bacterium]
MKKIAIALSTVALLLVLAACREEPPRAETETTIPVKTVELQPKSIREFITATGTALAVSDVQVKTEQAGRYELKTNPRTGRPFRMRDTVRKDEILAALVNPEFVNQTALDSKKLQLDSAEREFTKQKSVFEKGGITIKELDAAEKAFVDARYSYDNATLAAKKLEVRAPFDGVIVDLPHFTATQWVEANTIVAQVMDYSRLYADLTLPGKDMGRVARGQSILVSDYTQPDLALTGTVEQVSPALDAESRMFKLRVEIPNPGLKLRPGSFVKTDIIVGEKNAALVIPKAVILDRRGAKTVFVIDRGVALERRIQTGIENPDEIEVVSGLRPGDILVTEGFETLRDRSRVKIIE